MSWFILDASGSGLKLKMSFAPGIRNLLWRDASVPLVSASEVGLMFLFFHEQFRDFTGGSAVTNLPAMQETWRHMSNLWARKIPWRRKWQPASVFLPGESHGQRGLESYSPRGLKRVRHNWTTKQQQQQQKQSWGPLTATLGLWVAIWRISLRSFPGSLEGVNVTEEEVPLFTLVFLLN